MLKNSFIFLLFCIFSLSVLAQESGAPEKGKESFEELDKLDQGNNLERKQYKNISENNKDRVINAIKLLTIVTANFGDEVSDSKTALEKIKKDYQVVLRYYYRRAYIASGKAMVALEKDISTLLGKFSKSYDTKTQNLLAECADLITNQEQSQLVETSGEGSKAIIPYREIAEAQQKLRIAYGQMGLATDMSREDRFYDAIVHYRIAKDYGIKILSDFKEAEADKKAISDKYGKDLSDNRNQIFNQSQNAK
ncbi:hypothetical protein [Leptospira meyeri]|uniref:hypothetical protein n=1 Tax=Leptospira meyeri TaxID=29508 RepID=UPI000C2AB2B3|nr:hypothetical protein [Leptospira meyeri]PJZ82966.1 hypothetical protein CH359_02430 [Leptospira meyeri]PJZ97946.1 hypothetical protein CH358_02940 [Leptospira meyeri]PKA12641.1 hypothetical protein CH372_08145 [Leptospira meyeri]